MVMYSIRDLTQMVSKQVTRWRINKFVTYFSQHLIQSTLHQYYKPVVYSELKKYYFTFASFPKHFVQSSPNLARSIGRLDKKCF